MPLGSLRSSPVRKAWSGPTLKYCIHCFAEFRKSNNVWHFWLTNFSSRDTVDTKISCPKMGKFILFTLYLWVDFDQMNTIMTSTVRVGSVNLNIEVQWRINEGGLVWLPAPCPPPRFQSRPAQAPATIIVILLVISYRMYHKILYIYIFFLSFTEWVRSRRMLSEMMQLRKFRLILTY